MSRSINHTYPDGVTVSYHENKRDADKATDVERRRKRNVSRSVSYFQDPETKVHGRLHVVTSRPLTAWQRHAERESGYGVR